MKKIIIAFTLLAAITTGCRTTKDTTVTPNSGTTITPNQNQQEALDQRLSMLVNTQGNWNMMQVGGNVKVGGIKSLSSSMQMRMIRDKAIYISLRPMLGIEVGKIVITSDSVLVVDKYHKRYIAEPMSLITNGIPVTVGNLQDIFLGRSFVLGQGTVGRNNSKDCTLVHDGTNYRLSPKQQPKDFTYGFTYDENNKILAVEVTPVKGNLKPYKATYSDVKLEAMAGNIAHHVDVKANVGGTAFTLALDLKDITWSGDFTIDLTKPASGYKRMSANQITSILEGGN